jgi:hypothetical protein
MKLTSDMKNLSANILSSFKQRIKENESLVSEVQKTLDGFQKDHQEMASVLTSNAKALRAKLSNDDKTRIKDTTTFMKNVSKDNNTMSKTLRLDLNTGEKNRIMEFENLMKTINDDIVNINTEVSNIFKDTKNVLDNFGKDRKEMSTQLRNDLDKNLNETVDYTRNLLNGFKNRMDEIGAENNKMAKDLRKSLNTGEDERMNNSKNLMKGIHASISGIQKEVRNIQKTSNGLVGNYAKDREGATALWNKMNEVIAQLRNAEVGSSVTTKVVTHKQKEEIVVQTVDVSKTAPQTTLEQKILKYISQHPNGVKISEMEEPLGENRMKLGFVAKALIDEEKLQKIDNLFYLQK